MSKSRHTLLFVILSLFIHALALTALIGIWRKEPNAIWSGGRTGTTNAVFVTIAPEQGSGSDAPSPQPAPHKSQQLTNPQHPASQKKQPRHRPDPASKNAPVQIAGGTGNSTTPAGGIGAGLDHDGILADVAPNALAKIRKRIVAKQRYPASARNSGIEGSVKISFRIRNDGSLEFVKILAGSGHDILDQAALKAVREAAPLPYFNQAIALALEYKLK